MPLTDENVVMSLPDGEVESVDGRAAIRIELVKVASDIVQSSLVGEKDKNSHPDIVKTALAFLTAEFKHFTRPTLDEKETP